MTIRTTRALLAPLFTLALLAVAGGSVAHAQQSPVTVFVTSGCAEGAPILDLEFTNALDAPVVIGLAVGGEVVDAALEVEPGTTSLTVGFPLGENRSVEILSAEGEFLFGAEYDTSTPECPFLTITDSAECDGTLAILNVDVTNPGNVDLEVDLVVNGETVLTDQTVDVGEAVLFFGPFPGLVDEPLLELVDSASGEVIASIPITVAIPDCSEGIDDDTPPPTEFAPSAPAPVPSEPTAPPAAQPVAGAPSFTG